MSVNHTDSAVEKVNLLLTPYRRSISAIFGDIIKTYKFFNILFEPNPSTNNNTVGISFYQNALKPGDETIPNAVVYLNEGTNENTLAITILTKSEIGGKESDEDKRIRGIIEDIIYGKHASRFKDTTITDQQTKISHTYRTPESELTTSGHTMLKVIYDKANAKFKEEMSTKKGGRRSHKKTRRSHKKNHKKTLRRRR